MTSCIDRTNCANRLGLTLDFLNSWVYIHLRDLCDLRKGVKHLDEWLTPEEISSKHKLKPNTVTGWCRSGKLKGQKFGRQWRIRKTDWEAFLSEGQTEVKKVEGPIGYPYQTFANQPSFSVGTVTGRL